MNEKKIIIADFGSRYGQNVARKLRKLKAYCEVVPPKKLFEKIDENTLGIVLIGEESEKILAIEKDFPKEIFEKGIPVLGIAYGMQLMARKLGGETKKTNNDFQGIREIKIDLQNRIFKNMDSKQKVWLKEGIEISKMPVDFENISISDEKIYAIANENKNLYGISFHPELLETDNLLKNFLYEICKMPGNWTMENFAKDQIAKIRETVGEGKVLLALSGGVDSSVCARLISKACKKNLNSIFVDTGLMRKNEGDEVEAAFKDTEINFIRVDASERFLEKLVDVVDPELKRKIIGEEFIRVFEEEAKKIGEVDFLAQGTIYPDIIESGEDGEGLIKSHHNVGGLPDVVDFKELIEPLKILFKDEVRELGRVLGLSDELVDRQPFPGPGLAVRIMGDISKAKLDILREADYIYRKELKAHGLSKDINQYFCVLTDVRAVGVKKDKRTYERVLALRAIKTTDFMTAKIARLPYEFLEYISEKI
ncbi:MAG: glutamine-hydrolyzing GMP synthase, partial [Tissierellia bacterium]|nr:glutamine-hydrolyzing GMP synthase [Tissierellia bacterium]